jgi:hypothetical protein
MWKASDHSDQRWYTALQLVDIMYETIFDGGDALTGQFNVHVNNGFLEQKFEWKLGESSTASLIDSIDAMKRATGACPMMHEEYDLNEDLGGAFLISPKKRRDYMLQTVVDDHNGVPDYSSQDLNQLTWLMKMQQKDDTLYLTRHMHSDVPLLWDHKTCLAPQYIFETVPAGVHRAEGYQYETCRRLTMSDYGEGEFEGSVGARLHTGLHPSGGVDSSLFECESIPVAKPQRSSPFNPPTYSPTTVSTRPTHAHKHTPATNLSHTAQQPSTRPPTPSTTLPTPLNYPPPPIRPPTSSTTLPTPLNSPPPPIRPPPPPFPRMPPASDPPMQGQEEHRRFKSFMNMILEQRPGYGTKDAYEPPELSSKWQQLAGLGKVNVSHVYEMVFSLGTGWLSGLPTSDHTFIAVAQILRCKDNTLFNREMNSRRGGIPSDPYSRRFKHCEGLD